MRITGLITLVLLVGAGMDTAAQSATDTGIRVHDPVMAKHGDTYYLFATGRGIAVWASRDMRLWERQPPVFEEAPPWAVDAVPTFRGHFWAPDIHYHDGMYYLYYSVSAFGKNMSCIGVATNVTLDPGDERYKWIDRGKVIQSFPGKTNWNAIDPHIIVDEGGTAYMSFGSFWGGLKMIRLTPDRLQTVGDTIRLHTIASRNTNPNPIEAPFIFRKDGFYYLFASIDYCCKGEDSDYSMIVGRSLHVEGPYVDDLSIPLTEGGGKRLLAGDERWHGVGHNSVYTFDGTDYLVFHGYDAADKGSSKLRIERLAWDDKGWPILPEYGH